MSQRGRVCFHDLKPDVRSFLDEAIAGLSRPQKTLSPKYFYDERGCALFEAICELPEYYPTRTEMAIMQANAREITQRLGRGCVLIEYGSGSSRKTRLLIGEIEPALYMPIDIAGEQLGHSAAQLAQMFPDLDIAAVCADYSHQFVLPEVQPYDTRRRVIYFPGSTIGNFTGPEAIQFMENARLVAGAGGAMLVGVDLKKAHDVLHAAYNDTQGVTAAFNLNLLARINRELGADFDLRAFRHRAFYDESAGRVEMHLESLKDQMVSLGGHLIEFRAGETIHTENSCKYSISEFQALVRRAGFFPAHCWVDPQRFFSVHYLTVQQ